MPEFIDKLIDTSGYRSVDITFFDKYFEVRFYGPGFTKSNIRVELKQFGYTNDLGRFERFPEDAVIDYGYFMLTQDEFNNMAKEDFFPMMKEFYNSKNPQTAKQKMNL